VPAPPRATEDAGEAGEAEALADSDAESVLDSDDDSEGEGWPAAERLARAESSKTAGNGKFKEGANEEAVEFYQKGVNVLEPLADLEPPALEEGLKKSQVSLLVSLQLNKAAAEIRLERWVMAAKSAGRALEQLDRHGAKLEDVGKNRVKGLYRRAQARAKSGDLEEAKADLVALLKIDRANKDALREYTRVKKQLQAIKEEERRQYAAAFEKASKSGGMYGDKEREKKRKMLEKIEEERKRRVQWKQETGNAGVEQSFEDWCKEDDRKREAERKKREDEEKERRKKEEEERMARLAEERRKREEEGDEVELDEDEIKLLNETKKKGYCYFRTQHTEEEKALLSAASHTKPAKISEAGSAIQSVNSAGSNSAWNANGTTWEERDVTAVAKAELKSCLSTVTASIESAGLRTSINVSAVKSVTGHAQVVVTRGKPAPMFDMSAKIKWAASIAPHAQDGAAASTCAGELHLPDISTGVLEELDMALSVTEPPADEAHHAVLEKALQSFKRDVRRAIDDFNVALESK